MGMEGSTTGENGAHAPACLWEYEPLTTPTPLLEQVDAAGAVGLLPGGVELRRGVRP